MCVAQFREHCKASSFRHSTREEDMKNKDLKVRKETWYHNKRQWHYVTDLKELRRLANQGNEFAIAELNGM